MTIESSARTMVEGDRSPAGGWTDRRRSRLAGSFRQPSGDPGVRLLDDFAGAPHAPKLEHHHDPRLLSRLQFEAMTTRVGFWVHGNRPDVVDGLREARDFVLDVERRLSRFRPDSELSILNRSAGKGPQKVSKLLAEMVTVSLQLARQFPGLVDPTVLPALIKAGFGEGEAVGRIDSFGVEVDEEIGTVSLAPGVTLDFGGVAKGWMADKLALKLQEFGACLVDMGGDLRAAGDLAWPIGLENPWQPESCLGTFYLHEGAVATSSLLVRSRGQGRSHLIDPRTAVPVDNDLVAASVRADTALEAEGLAKATLILGGDQGRALLREKSARGILFGKDGRMR